MASELIEKQIEEAAEWLHKADERHVTTWRDVQLDVGDLILTVDRLLQIIQNQQAQIEELQKAQRDNDPRTALGALDEIVRRGQAGEFYSLLSQKGVSDV